jgi:hypothetical protein
MANEAYICRIRTDLSHGIVQITDLKPNTSRRSLTYDKVSQSGYLGDRVENDAVVTAAAGGDDVTAAAYVGLAAYLLDHVEATGLGAGTGAFSDADALTASTALIAIADAGGALTLAAINVALSLVAATTELTSAGGSASTGSVAEVLQIISGNTYTLPAGSVTETPTGTFNPSVSGTFDAGDYRQLYQSGAFSMSLGGGDLATLTAATFTYGTVAGAAAVCYDDTGAVLV